MAYSYPFPRPSVTVDIIVFRISENEPEVMLIKRAHEPFKGKWALPGGFVDKDEPLENAALRELREETGLSGILLTQMHTFGNPGRDPRGHTVSVVYVGYLSIDAKASAGDDADVAEWFSVDKLPDLAFDHDQIIDMAKSIFLV